LRTVLPHLLRLLPLLDGNIGSAVSNLLVPPAPASPPPPPVDLEPIEKGLAELNDGLAEFKTELRGQRAQMSEQSALLQTIESRLEVLEDAEVRNTIAQQELLKALNAVGNRVEELKIAGRKAQALARVTLGLLALSILLNLALILRVLHILP